MTTAVLPDVVANDNISFEYAYVPVGDLKVETTVDKMNGKTKISGLNINGETLRPTERFWTSLYARYGFNSSFFKYFDHAEVFERIAEKEKNDRMRICIERGDSSNKVLAVSNPNRPLVNFNEIYELVAKYAGVSVNYHNGVLESTHTPRNGGNMISLGSDDFKQKFVLSCPIDGYGEPNVYLSLLRLVCQNGMVGYGKTFRSSVGLGKGADDVRPSLVRVLDGFGNEEGFAAMRQRIEASQKSWASVGESQSLYKMLLKCVANNTIDNDSQNKLSPGLRKWYDKSNSLGFADVRTADETWAMPITRSFEGMTGSPTLLYGLANTDSLSAKRQRTLPVNCTVYDLVNFATEVATHHSDPSAARKLQGWVGETISNEYDMENTRDKFTEFKDFHLGSKVSAGVTGSVFSGDN
jgi:hypothetical protein